MADPVAINGIMKFITDYGLMMLVGLLTMVGGIVLVLKRMGILVFGQPSHPPSATYKCDCYDYLRSNVDDLQAAQIKMLAQQCVNTEALANGKMEFKKIKDRIDELRIGVAVLLDRSGGKPPGWHDSMHKED